MNTTLWIFAAVLAVACLAGGAVKLFVPRARLAATPNQGWAEDFSDSTVKTIGALEVLAAVGLILPAALDIAPVMVPVAAVGLVLLLSGAFLTHLRRGERDGMAFTLLLVALNVFLAWGRFGPQAF